MLLLARLAQVYLYSNSAKALDFADPEDNQPWITHNDILTNKINNSQ